MSPSPRKQRRTFAAAVAQVDDLARIFKSLADPTRLRLLLALGEAGELCVHELCARVPLSQPAVSHQLGLLRRERLVRSRRAGREIFYALDDAHVVGVLSAGLVHARHGGRP